jgi:ATP-dependent helicase/DNAse subunit B
MIPMPHEPKAVELVGWLDLAMDDAEVVIVTGMNDGVVPAFQTSDMFLPDTMRQRLAKEHRLSIEDNHRRYARDAYALSSLLATRQNDPLRIQLIGSRRSVEGDPMLPSRLFFAADDETVTKRVKNCFDDRREPTPKITLPRPKHRAEIAFAIPTIPEQAGKTIKEMRVTEFKEYKVCPYRYYLKCRLRLKALNDTDDELNAMSFGTAIHQVLDWFGKEEKLKKSTSAEKIQEFLIANFREWMRKEYGGQQRSVIRIQTERAIKRLEAFADWQANWAATHEILETELQFRENRFSLDVDGNAMILHGTIDRIDWDKENKELIVLDYKTGKGADPKEHLQKGEWVDFQLPLYYHLLGQHEEYAERLRSGYQLGYIVLPSATKPGEKLAKWDRPVESAIDDARQIVRCIWNNEFDKTDPPPKHSEAFAAICNDF